MALPPSSYNVYNIVLNAPSITVIPYDTIYLTNFNKTQLVTAQVQQVYHGCTLATEGQIVGYKKTPDDMSFQADGLIYGLINDDQIKFWWQPTVVTVIPPS